MKDQKSFTLIELLVVIAVIGLLASITLVSLKGAIEKAKSGKAQAELRQFKSAVEVYYSQYGSYPCPGHYMPGWDGDPTTCLRNALGSSFPATDPWGSYYIWHLHPGSCECTSFISIGPDKAYGGYQPCPPCHCQAGGDDLISVVSAECQ